MKSTLPLTLLVAFAAQAFAQNRLDSKDYVQLSRELAHVSYISCPPKAAIRYKEKKKRGLPVQRKYMLASGKFLFKGKYKYERNMLVSSKYTTPVLSAAPYVKSIFNYDDSGNIVAVDILHRKEKGNRVYETRITKYIDEKGKVTQNVSKSSWKSVSAADAAARARRSAEASQRQRQQSSDAFLSALSRRSSNSNTNGPVVIVSDRHHPSCNRYYDYNHRYNPVNERGVPYHASNPHYYSRYVNHSYSKVKYRYDSRNRLERLSFIDRSNLTVGYIRYVRDSRGNLTDVRFYWNSRLEKRFRFTFDSNGRIASRSVYNGNGQLMY